MKWLIVKMPPEGLTASSTSKYLFPSEIHQQITHWDENVKNGFFSQNASHYNHLNAKIPPSTFLTPARWDYDYKCFETFQYHQIEMNFKLKMRSDSFLWSVERNQEYFPVKIFWRFSHNFRILASVIFLNHFITSNIIEISNYRKLLENIFLCVHKTG